MTIILRPEQEQVLLEAINSGLAHTTDEALDQALDALRLRLPRQATPEAEAAAAVRRLAASPRPLGEDFPNTERKPNLFERATTSPKSHAHS
jgi:hypothetical protein